MFTDYWSKLIVLETVFLRVPKIETIFKQNTIIHIYICLSKSWLKIQKVTKSVNRIGGLRSPSLVPKHNSCEGVMKRVPYIPLRRDSAPFMQITIKPYESLGIKYKVYSDLNFSFNQWNGSGCVGGWVTINLGENVNWVRNIIRPLSIPCDAWCFGDTLFPLGIEKDVESHAVYGPQQEMGGHENWPQ